MQRTLAKSAGFLTGIRPESKSHLLLSTGKVKIRRNDRGDLPANFPLILQKFRYEFQS